MSLTSRMQVKILQLSGMKGKLAKGSQKTFEEAVSYNRKSGNLLESEAEKRNGRAARTALKK